jgi:hypothetical protein
MVISSPGSGWLLSKQKLRQSSLALGMSFVARIERRQRNSCVREMPWRKCREPMGQRRRRVWQRRLARSLLYLLALFV